MSEQTCTATTSGGRPCRRHPKPGDDVCRYHSEWPAPFHRYDPLIIRKTVTLDCGCERKYEIAPRAGERLLCPFHNRMAMVKAEAPSEPR
jgi:hypothetical protein